MLGTIRNASRRKPRLKTYRYLSANIQLPGPSRSVSEGPSSSGEPPDQGSNSQNSDSSSSHAIIAAPPSPPYSGDSQAHPFAGAKEYAENAGQQANNKQEHGQSTLPALPQTRPQDATHINTYAIPPFDTHHFYVELERSFPPHIAKSLMGATRALVVDRLGRVRREALSSKDMENVMCIVSLRSIILNNNDAPAE